MPIKVTAEQYQEVVANFAFNEWKKKNPERARRNWLDAEQQLERQLDRSPEHWEIGRRAELLWKIHKDSDAMMDWLIASSRVCKLYEIA